MSEQSKLGGDCWPWTHQWTQWEKRQETWEKPMGGNLGRLCEYTKEFQERRCLRCGLFERRNLA